MYSLIKARPGEYTDSNARWSTVWLEETQNKVDPDFFKMLQSGKNRSRFCTFLRERKI